jgi:hypothetical protein
MPRPLKKLAAPVGRRYAWGPVHHCADLLENLQAPRIWKEQQAILQRIDARRRRKLVEEALYG